MAEAVELASTKYFCHHCSREVSPLHTVELICPDCSSGFIEEVSRDLYEAQEDYDAGQYDEIDDIMAIDNAFRIQNMLGQALHNVGIDDDDDDDAPEVGPDFPSNYFEEVLFGLDSGEESRGNLRYFGDYMLGDNIDALVTQFLNEVEISGPPPLAKAEIKSLPTMAITKEHIETGIQCTVCMEDFALREKVKCLPCQHFYHEKCITPWLERHATCPNCRETVETKSSCRSRRSVSCPRSNTHSDGESQHNSESSASSSSSSSLSDFFSTSINPFRFLH